jgi:protocatechuate 3,4-dioxygenase beta subunit
MSPGRDWGTHPPLLAPEYRSTALRAPRQPLIPIPESISEQTGPGRGGFTLNELERDLSRNARRNGEPLGERIIVTGHVLDEDGRPIPGTLVEIWQANAAGRYVHGVDRHDAPLDPNFLGSGRCLTDDSGAYGFTTIRPGAYPWPNHPNAWRPSHIHFSLLGPSITARLVTQMYFPGDPLLPFDPIFNAVPAAARDRLVSRFSLTVTKPDFALGFVFDIVLGGRRQTPLEG